MGLLSLPLASAGRRARNTWPWGTPCWDRDAWGAGERVTGWVGRRESVSQAASSRPAPVVNSTNRFIDALLDRTRDETIGAIYNGCWKYHLAIRSRDVEGL